MKPLAEKRDIARSLHLEEVGSVCCTKGVDTSRFQSNQKGARRCNRAVCRGQTWRNVAARKSKRPIAA